MSGMSVQGIPVENGGVSGALQGFQMLELEEVWVEELGYLGSAPCTQAQGPPTPPKCLCPTEETTPTLRTILSFSRLLGPHCTWLPGPSRLCECVSGLRVGLYVSHLCCLNH